MVRARRAVTMVELTLGIAILAVFLALLWRMVGGAGRQTAQIEQTAGLIGAATLVHDALARDLIQSLPRAALPPADAPLDTDLASLKLALAEGYKALEAKPVKTRELEYRWDPAAKQLFRDGKPLVRDGLEAVSFRWIRDGGTLLTVKLTGAALEGRTKDMVLRLMGPPAEDGPAGWVPAPHHRY